MNTNLGSRLLGHGLAILLGCSFGCPCLSQAQKQDYLTEQEIEQLREAQAPAERVKLLVELLEKRLDGARKVKDPAFVKTKPEEPPPAKKKETSQKKEETSPEVQQGKGSDVQPAKSFGEWMNEYLQCLEEVSANLESFANTATDYKAYLKSLNKLDESLQEHTHWISQIQGRLGRSELKIVEEVSEVSQELAEDVKSASEKAKEQIKLLKEAQKNRSRN